MRTLKKTLSLVLALVLCFGLVGTAFAGNFDGYTDVDEIGAQYKEAIDVMMAIDVISGMSATEIGATGTLTREQAAKIVAYLALGKDLADATTANAAPFKDVAADRWSAGYISYCAQKGILAGYGDGNFGPADELTGYQFAKMLLAALGYGKAGEFAPDSWALNTGIKAFELNIFKGDAKAATHEVITRQQAMLMAFNALSQKLVNFDKDIEDYEFKTPAVALGDKFDYQYNAIADNGYGMTGYNYVNAKNQAITEFYCTDTLVGTYGVGTTVKAICADLGITAKTAATVTGQWYANCVAKGATFAMNSKINDTTKVPAGVVLNVYKTIEGNYKVMATIEYVVAATKGAKVTDTTSENYGKTAWTFGSYASAVVYAGETDYTNNALYVVTPFGDNTAATKFLSVTAAESVSGKITATGTTAGVNYVKIGADKYNLATGVSVPAVNAEKVLYFFSDGNVAVIGNPGTVTPTETVVFVVDFFEKFVAGTPAVKDEYGTITKPAVADKTEVYAQCIDMDGAEVTYLVAAADNTAKATLKKVVYTAATKLYSFENATSVVSAATIDKAKVSFAVSGVNYYYDKASYVSVLGSKANLTVADGTLAAADTNGAAWAVFSGTDATNKTISKVFYWAAAPAPVDTTYTYTMAATGASYIETSKVTHTAQDGTTSQVDVYTYEVYLAGEKTTVMTYTNTLAKDFYKYAVDKYGVYEVVELDGFEGAVTNIYGNYLTITSVCENYDITGIKLVDLRTGAAADGKIEAGDTIAFYAQAKNTTPVTYTIDCIYIVG